MGLDMYLCEIVRTENHTAKPEVMYWRKSNAIHAYIIDTHAEGVDECQVIPLKGKDLRNLGRLCQVVADCRDHRVSHRVLPTRGGFFFGSTHYDTQYYEDMENTAYIIEMILKDAENPNMDEVSFEYQASW